MAALQFGQDFTAFATGGGFSGYLSYGPNQLASQPGPYGALTATSERVWFDAADGSTGSVMVGNELNPVSHVGEVIGHYLEPLSTSTFWVKGFRLNRVTPNFWIIQTTDGSTTIDEGTPFTLQTAGGEYLMATQMEGFIALTTGPQSSALVFKATF